MSLASVYKDHSEKIKEIAAALGAVGTLVPAAKHGAQAIHALTHVLETECGVAGADPDAPIDLPPGVCHTYNKHRKQLESVAGLLETVGKNDLAKPLELFIHELNISCPVR